jgi:hypothetical protein
VLAHVGIPLEIPDAALTGSLSSATRQT